MGDRITDLLVLPHVPILPSPPRPGAQIPGINVSPPLRRAHPHTRNGKLSAIHLPRIPRPSLPPSPWKMAPPRHAGGDSVGHRIGNARVWKSGFGKGMERVGEFWVGGVLCGLDTALDVGNHVVFGEGEEGEWGCCGKQIETR